MECSYDVDALDTISVVFERIERIILLADFDEAHFSKNLAEKDGVEVFSRFLREEEALSLLRSFDE
ncbi:MAG: hypothetical protein AB7I68_13610 [Porticoccaceae bacterium]